MRARGTSGVRPPGSAERMLWQRCQEIEASPDDGERFLDLAGFADNSLDDDDAAPVAALLESDPAAAEDVAVARGLAGADLPDVDEHVILRAISLADEANEGTSIIQFPISPRRRWRDVANWTSLAAGIAFACWIGFDLGSGVPSTLLGHSSNDSSLSEFLDPSPPPFRDFGEGWRT